MCDLSPVASSMNKPRIFLGSSGKQAKLLQAIARGLEDLADVEPWTTTFNPGRSTLDRALRGDVQAASGHPTTGS